MPRVVTKPDNLNERNREFVQVPLKEPVLLNRVQIVYAYLHLAFMFDWRNIASAAETPWLLFRFLPYYSMFAGAIGAAIGWIIGRDLDRRRNGRPRS